MLLPNQGFVGKLNDFYALKRRKVKAYRGELLLMGQLAEQLIVALHQGSVATGLGPVWSPFYTTPGLAVAQTLSFFRLLYTVERTDFAPFFWPFI